MSVAIGFSSYLALFFAGVFLCNCIPHLAAGLRGEPFPTPFAKPRGVGHSAPWVNTLWGFFNLFVGGYLLAGQPITLGLNFGCISVLLGALALGMYLSLHFAKVRAEHLGNH
jgi:hypothetical protein